MKDFLSDETSKIKVRTSYDNYVKTKKLGKSNNNRYVVLPVNVAAGHIAIDDVKKKKQTPV